MDQSFPEKDATHQQAFVDVPNTPSCHQKDSYSDGDSSVDGTQYSWTPSGLTKDQIEAYFSRIPPSKVPRLGTTGQSYRASQLAFQIPRQDLALACCKFVQQDFRVLFQDFVDTRNICALDIGRARVSKKENDSVCQKCHKKVHLGDIIVTASKLQDSLSENQKYPEPCWHPKCFVCTDCNELLVDLVYCVRNGKLYCERHYAEKVKPRCALCDELIFSADYTKAMNKDWHSDHFSCDQCDDSLSGQKYVLRDDKPFCIKCYELHYANKCEECNDIIGIDSKDLSYKDRHWHEACFKCNKCQVSLVDKPFGSKADKVYCGDCYDTSFASRCDGCNQPFKAGMKKMEYKGRQWHENCFVCVVCQNPIGTKSFIPKDNEIYCTGCYEDKFATRCIKCTKVITAGGVTYRNAPWHRECFTCISCDRCLAGQRFTSKEEKPYCAECYGELFAKRCSSCQRPITGIGGTRFISFEDRNWHHDCFICAMCSGSLVGKGFITDADDILCPECAKKKLL